MKRHHDIERLLDQAQRERRCVFATSPAEDRALRRRLTDGKLVKPFPALFADAAYWQRLDPSQRVLHQARALTLRHPQWVFAGPTAAAIHGFQHQWSIHNAGIYICARNSGTGCQSRYVKRVYNPPGTSMTSHMVQRLPVTTAARTVVDCANILPFHLALPIADSAIAMHPGLPTDISAITEAVRSRRAPKLLLKHANPASENGGESLARGVMLEEGFFAPKIQHVFVDPHDPNHWYRVDFVWFLPNGRILVAEYDGMMKYTDPTMTNRQSIRSVVHEQSQRERYLLAWGVAAICRLDFEDVINRRPLIRKLTALGVPRHPTRVTDAIRGLYTLSTPSAWITRE